MGRSRRTRGRTLQELRAALKEDDMDGRTDGARERQVFLSSEVEVLVKDQGIGRTDQQVIDEARAEAMAINRREVCGQIMHSVERGAWAIEVHLFGGHKVLAPFTRDGRLIRTKPIKIQFLDLRPVRMVVLPVHCDCGAKHRVSLW